MCTFDPLFCSYIDVSTIKERFYNKMNETPREVLVDLLFREYIRGLFNGPFFDSPHPRIEELDILSNILSQLDN